MGYTSKIAYGVSLALTLKESSPLLRVIKDSQSSAVITASLQRFSYQY